MRVRSRPLAEVDEAKLAVALALMARRLLEQRVGHAEDRPHETARAPGEAA